MQTKKVRYAVIAAAGYGTRFLTWTKSMPKEMLYLDGKPIIQHVVEELVDAGVETIIIVGNSSKRPIEEHFAPPSADLLENLRSGGSKKARYIDKVNEISRIANFVYLRQEGEPGNAAPVFSAAHLLEGEPFFFMFADDLFYSPKGVLTQAKQMLQIYNETGGSVLACKRIEADYEYDIYGTVAGENIRDGLVRISTIIEKPGKENAPSNKAAVSGFLFIPEVAVWTRKVGENFNGADEFMIQPVIQSMIDEGYRFFAKEIEDSVYYDTGNQFGYIKTFIDYSIRSQEFGGEVKDYITKKAEEISS